MACLMNYTIHCTDITTGTVGCFLFDEEHWVQTGEFKAISPVFPGLVSFYAGTASEDRKSVYLERSGISGV